MTPKLCIHFRHALIQHLPSKSSYKSAVNTVLCQTQQFSDLGPIYTNVIHKIKEWRPLSHWTIECYTSFGYSLHGALPSIAIPPSGLIYLHFYCKKTKKTDLGICGVCQWMLLWYVRGADRGRWWLIDHSLGDWVTVGDSLCWGKCEWGWRTHDLCYFCVQWGIKEATC